MSIAASETRGRAHRRAAGGNLEDDALLLAMARQTLGTPADDGRSSHQISYEPCPARGEGAQLAAGELVPVGAEVLAMATCDGECIGARATQSANENGPPQSLEPERTPATPATHAGRARQAVPPALRRAVLLTDRHRCRVLGCTNTHYVDVHHIWAAEAYAKVFAGLRLLGFRERDVHAVLAELRGDRGLATAAVDVLPREASCRIKPARSHTK